VGIEIDQGKYDKEINEEKTETSPEKRKELDAYFSELHAQQEKLIKQEEAAKAVPEEPVAEEAKTEQKPAEPKKK
jgi:hypothetical protein